MEITKEKEREHIEGQDNLALVPRYFQWVLNHFGAIEGRRVWDAGAGIGILASLLQERAAFLYLTEIGDENLAHLRTRFEGKGNVRVEHCDLLAPNIPAIQAHAIDLITNFDVLEHIEDDEKVLRTFHDALAPKGEVLIKVPAHPSLYCDIDRATLHYRRYSKKELREKMERAGFTVRKLRYMNMLGVLLYIVKGKILREKKHGGTIISKGSFKTLNAIIPILEGVEKVVPPLFGLSLVAVGRKGG